MSSPSLPISLQWRAPLAMRHLRGRPPLAFINAIGRLQPLPCGGSTRVISSGSGGAPGPGVVGAGPWSFLPPVAGRWRREPPFGRRPMEYPPSIGRGAIRVHFPTAGSGGGYMPDPAAIPTQKKITIGRVGEGGGGVPRDLVRVCFWGFVVRLPLRRSSLGLCRSDSISDRTNPTIQPPCSIAHRSSLSIPKERSHNAGSLTTTPPKNKPFAPATWRPRHRNGGR